ncbi:sigma-70 family RNA polymerase sigma factor [Nocardioides marmoriginsengisoli]|uniref:Sigma-70 family RNA polymerase sigma factor n=1 Tax=Nocardioides marmoriginsengisoli TaxID=661483 RepID=A0A3N0CEV1_9ACTN|nr:sigma-70 family RNA polymerase sigma factor [Nocardioides marmoriginsengisoli]RNL61972.1 sigma-70 family RNA polymerase sigma factor [Nocardioides marmoriginsengisoli]
MDATSDAGARRTRFESVAAEVVEPVRRYLARRTDAATADDVLGDVLLVLWRRFDDVPGTPLPWAYGVARNCLANAERGARRQQRVAARITAVDPPREIAPEDPEADERVRRALERVRPTEAELLRLWAWEELSPSEIAEVLGITPNAAGIRLHRARESFKAEFRKDRPGPGHDQVTEGDRT